MKKILFSIVVAVASVCALAQTPTWDFESWTGSGATIEPTGWASGNVLTAIPGNQQSVFQATSPDVHGGTYAMKIVTVDVVTNPDPTQIPDPIGAAFTGTLNGPTFVLGFAYTARPATAEFWYKNTLSGADTASFFMWLTKWNGTTRDTIAEGYWETSSSTSTYTHVTVTLIYNPAFPNTLPDTAVVIFSATGVKCLTCGNVGSTLWVDDVTFSGWNGVNEYPSSNGVILYPNPASVSVNISVDTEDASSVVAYDVTGRAVASASLSEPVNSINKKAGVINTSNLSTGLYSYSVIDKSGNILRAGKFNVVR
jgi:hypothetical protein